MESDVLLAVAFDRYVTICDLLHYTTILTVRVLSGIRAGVALSAVVLTLPMIYLIHCLDFCNAHIIAHTYHEHMGIAKLACANIQINAIYSLFVASFIVLVLVLVGISYGYIIHAVFRLKLQEACHKPLSTCSSHAAVMFVF